jgi:hypothetical protein
MNQVFMPRSVGCDVDQNEKTKQAGFASMFALSIGGAVGGTVMTVVLALVGLAALALDRTDDHLVVLAGAAAVGFLAVILEAGQRLDPLPQRRRQVPRRWLHWRQPWLTALGFGALLGAGAFTYLRHATMYSLALMALLAPNIPTAAVLGAVYGGNRGASVLYTWLGRRLRWNGLQSMGRATSPLLAIAGIAVPLWIMVRCGT